MATGFRKILEGLRLIPKAASTASEKGDLDVTSSSGKLNYHDGTSASPVVTEDHSATLTNKTLDAADSINGLSFNGSTSGSVTVEVPATVTSYTVTLPASQGAASTVLTNDGSGNLSWVAGGGGGGANTSLSNLTSPTAVNQDLIPSFPGSISIGNSGNPINNVQSFYSYIYNGANDPVGSLSSFIGSTTPSGATDISFAVQGVSGSSIGFFSGSSTGPSIPNGGKIRIESGEAFLAGASSGDVIIKTGNSLLGSRGTVQINPELRLTGSTSGYVGLKSPASPTSHTLTLPTAQGSANTFLRNDGSGNLSWTTPPIPTDVAISALDVDWSLGDTFYKNISISSTFTFSNLINGKTILVILKNTGASDITVTFPTALKSGVLYNIISPNKENIYTCIRSNGKTYISAIADFE